MIGRPLGAAPVDVGEAVEAADRRQTAVDGRRCQPSCLERCAIELDMGTGRFHDRQSHVCSPLEVRPQVVAVGLERTTRVTGEERGGSDVGFSMWIASRQFDSERGGLDSGHDGPPW